MGREKKTIAETYQVKLSQNAIQNIDEITGYIAIINNQPQNAISIGDSFFKTMDRILANPLAFSECKQLVTSSKLYRKALCYSWLIIYRVKNSEILILGIIHKSSSPATLKALRRIKQ